MSELDPNDFKCPRCGGNLHHVSRPINVKVFQCEVCIEEFGIAYLWGWYESKADSAEKARIWFEEAVFPPPAQMKVTVRFFNEYAGEFQSVVAWLDRGLWWTGPNSALSRISDHVIAWRFNVDDPKELEERFLALRSVESGR